MGDKVQELRDMGPIGSRNDAAWSSTSRGETDSRDRRLEQALRALTAISAPSRSTEDFFRTCVEHLAIAYGTRYAFIGLFDDPLDKSHITTIAGYADGAHIPSMTYPLYGSPCQDVLCVDKVFIASGLRDKYPEDELLITMGLESYFGSALKNADGEAIGLIVVTDTGPMAPDVWNSALLDLFSDRISFELERARADEQLRLSASVFQGCRDGIIIMSPQWTVLSINQSGTAMTGWDEAAMAGQHIFVLRSDRESDAFFRAQTIQLLKQGVWDHELWIRHRSGKVFPIDCSIKMVRDPVTGEASHYVMMMTDISEQKYAEQRIERLAYFDPVTELPNRTLFQERLNEILGESRGSRIEFAVMLLDLDGFKAVNDRLGHAAGDALLIKLAKRLQTLPQADFFSARLGGDEFAILYLSQGSAPNGAADDPDRPDCIDGLDRAASELVDLISMPYDLDGDIATVTASVGIALFPRDGDDAPALLHHADLATYHAKAKGRNRHEYFHSSLCEKAENAAVLQSLLHKALREDQFFMVYQSRHAVSDRSTTGAEALIRWKVEDGTLISPAQFIPVAEESGLIRSIGDWVLGAVFRQVVAWENLGVEFGQISINVSGRQVLDPGFPEMLARRVAETGVNPRSVELEITETWLMQDPNRSIGLLADLKSMGFSLAIDDFGVAYSSMNYLRHFPVDTIKIDRSFIRDINSEKNSLAIISAIVAMGHSLGLNVLAEGVETEDQLQTLQSIGCDECQGFFFSKPNAPEQFVSRIAAKPHDRRHSA